SSRRADYSIGASIAQWEAITRSIVASFPHTQYFDQNNYFAYDQSSATTTGDVTVADGDAGASASGPDVFSGLSSYTWGQLAYIGSAAGGTAGFSSLIGSANYVALVEEPDYAPSTLSGITTTALQDFHASHVFWCVEVLGAGVEGDWTTTVLPNIEASPIPSGNEACPSNFRARGGCDRN
ncbi:MAG: hypothetical protein ACLQVI_39210, partial [Polyangiaceae bacterium]